MPDEGLEVLRPLLEQGGPIPGMWSYRVEVLRDMGPGLFSQLTARKAAW